MSPPASGSKEPVHRTVHFSGQVQGVGFRYTAERIAKRYVVTGFVRNLPDGRVELVAEGSPQELDRFIQAVHEAMRENISDSSTIELTASGKFPGFRITR